MSTALIIALSFTVGGLVGLILGRLYWPKFVPVTVTSVEFVCERCRTHTIPSYSVGEFRSGANLDLVIEISPLSVCRCNLLKDE